jgi:hypothetical protein
MLQNPAVASEGKAKGEPERHESVMRPSVVIVMRIVVPPVVIAMGIVVRPVMAVVRISVRPAMGIAVRPLVMVAMRIVRAVMRAVVLPMELSVRPAMGASVRIAMGIAVRISVRPTVRIAVRPVVIVAMRVVVRPVRIVVMASVMPSVGPAVRPFEWAAMPVGEVAPIERHELFHVLPALAIVLFRESLFIPRDYAAQAIAEHFKLDVIQAVQDFLLVRRIAVTVSESRVLASFSEPDHENPFVFL